MVRASSAYNANRAHKRCGAPRPEHMTQIYARNVQILKTEQVNTFDKEWARKVWRVVGEGVYKIDYLFNRCSFFYGEYTFV